MKKRKKIVKRSFQKWEEKGDDISGLFDKDVQWMVQGTGTFSQAYKNRESAMAWLANRFNHRLSGRLLPKLNKIYHEGKTVLVLWEGSATARDGVPYKNTFLWILTFRKMRVIKVIEFFDTLTMQELVQRVPAAV